MKYAVEYEFPLNEFIRNSLKINRLMEYFTTVNEDFSEIGLRNRVARLLELHSLLCRTELKNELIKEIDKRHKKLAQLKGLDNVNHGALDTTISQLEKSIGDLKSIPPELYSKPLPHLVDAVKQRSLAPGGQFDFDLPGYKCWLCSDPELCHHEAMKLIEDFTAVTSTVSMFLDLLRQSAVSENCVAENGFFQLKGGHDPELIIIKPDSNLRIFPEVSGGKHRVFIRFLHMPDIENRPAQTKDNIRFSMKSCYI